MAAPVWKIDNDGTPLYLTDTIFSESFEDTTINWSYGANATVTGFGGYSGWGSAGSKSLKVDATFGVSHYTAAYNVALIPVISGQSYTATADANVLTTRSGASVYLQFDWHNSGTGYIGGSLGVGQSGTGVLNCSLTATAPTGAAFVRIELVQVSASTTGTMSAAWDNVTLRANGSPYFLTGQQLPTPDLEPQYASSVTTEGDRLQTQRYRNRKITLNMRVIGGSSSSLQSAIDALQQKVGKINRDAMLSGTGYGGTLEYTSVNGSTVTFDVCSASVQTELGKPYVVRNGTDVTLEFECAPFARGKEAMAAYTLETLSPAVVLQAGIVNDKFDENINGWAYESDDTGSATTYQWTSGSLEIRKSSTSANKYISSIFDGNIGSGPQPWIPVTPGATYTATASAYVQAAPAASNVFVALQFFKSDGTYVGVVNSDVSLTTGEKAYVASGPAPGEAAYCRLKLLCYNGNTAGDFWVYWREVTLDAGRPRGDVPALGRLIVDEYQGVDQASVLWGLRSRTYSGATTAKLFWEAEALTPMNAGAATAAVSGASGSGNNTILAGNLATSFQPILKSTVSSTYWTHTGAYRVFARCSATANGNVYVRASWALNDPVNFSKNAQKAVTAGAQWSLVDLGTVRIPDGTSRWELRLEAMSTVKNDDIYVDYIVLAPVDEGFGVASVTAASSAAVLSASDEFTQTTGPNSQSLSELGGSWATGGGDSDDFSMDTTNARAQRTAVSDTATTSTIRDGRFMVESTSSSFAAQRASVKLYASTDGGTVQQGVLLRYTDNSNFIAVTLAQAGTGRLPGGPVLLRPLGQLNIYVVVGGSVVSSTSGSKFYLGTANYPKTLTASVSKFGTVQTEVDWAEDISLTTSYGATGSTLATGKYGLVDWNPAAGACTRGYDSFYGYQLTSDAAMYASQSLSITSNTVIREDSTGTVWARPARYEGDYFLMPAAGKEARTVQVLVKGSRALIDSAGDSGIDDISARLYVTPRYLQLPG